MSNGTIWLHYARPRSHWYELDAARQETLKASWQDVRTGASASGAQQLGTYHIRGNHDFETVEIWSFPNAEAAYAHWVAMTDATYNEWFAYANNLGFASAP